MFILVADILAIPCEHSCRIEHSTEVVKMSSIRIERFERKTRLSKYFSSIALILPPLSARQFFNATLL